MIIAPPNPETRKITTLLTDLEVRMKRAEAGLRAAQLGNASVTDAGLNVYDSRGTLRGILGKQRDGTFTTTSLNNTIPPPVPSSPVIISAIASLIVRHTGETASGVSWPADFSHLNVYYALAANPDQWTSGGTLIRLPDEIPICPLEYTDYIVAVTAVNESGQESSKSVPSSGSPSQVVPNDLIQGFMDDLQHSANSVSEAMLQIGSVTETKIAPDSISSPLIKANAILGVHILADQIDGTKIIAQSITGREIRALAITADKIDANTITAGHIQAGAVTAVKLEANMVISNRFIAGSSSGNRVELHPLLGLQAFTGGGATKSFWLDAATGSALLIGEIRTAAVGTRIIMNPDGVNPDRIAFWPDGAGGTADFAFIDSFPEGAVDTGITMQASGGQASKVGTIWLRRAYAALGIADNGLNAGSQFYAEPNFVRCRSATIDLMVDQAITPINGPRRVVFLNANTSNQPVGNSALYYGTATANQYPMLYKPEFNIGFIFDGGGYIAVVHNDATYSRATIEAAEFRIGSDSRLKRDVSNISWSGGALGVITKNPAKKWKRITSEVRTEDMVHQPERALHKDDNGDTVFTGVEVPKDDEWHFGPMADNLPDDLVYIDSDNGTRQLGVSSMIGVLWKAVEELTAKVKELEDGRG